MHVLSFIQKDPFTGQPQCKNAQVHPPVQKHNLYFGIKILYRICTIVYWGRTRVFHLYAHFTFIVTTVANFEMSPKPRMGKIGLLPPLFLPDL